MVETPILQIDAVHCAVAGRAILAGASLVLHTGAFVAMVGPNGAGKTSLLRVAAGEIAPDTGAVLWNGEPIAAIPAPRLAATRAVMSQSTAIGLAFPVADVVGIGFDAIGRRVAPDVRRRAITRALDAADVFHLAGRDVTTLSGGERQRVLFAKALAQLEAGRSEVDRRALLLDEPIASLDLAHQIALMRAVRTVADDGVAVLAVLHDLNLAAAFADRIVVVDAGRVAADAPPATAIGEPILRSIFGVVRRHAGPVSVGGAPVVTAQFWDLPNPYERTPR